MYVPSVLRLPILLSTAVIEFVFFVIFLFKLEASTLIVGPSVPSFFVSFVLPLPSSPILIVDQVSLKIWPYVAASFFPVPYATFIICLYCGP